MTLPHYWKPKIFLTLGFVLVSVYLLIPTLLDFGVLREKSEKDGTAPPFYVRLFPKEEINLGLDLRGGIYVEVEVEEADAVNSRADVISSEILNLLAKENFKPVSAARAPDSSDIKITLAREEDREALGGWIRDNYSDVLQEVRDLRADKIAVYRLSENFMDRTKDMAVRQGLEIIRNRFDRFGVTEPSIVRLGTNRISIELPGVADPERAMSMIKQSGKLEFHLVDESVKDQDVQKMVVDARQVLNPEGFPEHFDDEAVRKINEHLKGEIPEDDEVLFEIQRDPVTKKITGGIPYLLKRKAEVTGDMLKNVQVNVQDNQPYVSLTFNQLGTRLFAELTKANVNKRLAIVLDRQVSKAPNIQSEIPNGQAQITLGGFDYQSLLKEAEDLTLVLREGALPARLKELTKTVVGPSLGQDSIRRGVQISLFAGGLVMLFMLVYYKLSGLLANIALLLNVLFIMATLSAFQATLTLPGIAGIVLTIGMAVDANVLIFERMREEIRAGKSALTALKEGYQNANSAIIDSNITTFLSGLVLYQFGTGPIRGFAVTLMIGIVMTLFTAIIVTRVLQEGILFGLKREKLSV
jgi:preprotein translocase subunit SecD